MITLVIVLYTQCHITNCILTLRDRITLLNIFNTYYLIVNRSVRITGLYNARDSNIINKTAVLRKIYYSGCHQRYLYKEYLFNPVTVYV